MNVTIVPFGRPCDAGHWLYCWIGLLIALLPWWLTLFLGHVREASPQWGHFWIRSRLCPSHPMSEICGVFSNRDIPSFCGRCQHQGQQQ